jgi:hypothetical protein
VVLSYFLYNYWYIGGILVIRHPDGGHRSDWNVLMKNNMWLNIFINVPLLVYCVGWSLCSASSILNVVFHMWDLSLTPSTLRPVQQSQKFSHFMHCKQKLYKNVAYPVGYAVSNVQYKVHRLSSDRDYDSDDVSNCNNCDLNHCHHCHNHHCQTAGWM